MEFQILEVGEAPAPGNADSSTFHPPQVVLPPTSEAIVVNAQTHPPETAQALPTYELIGNKMIVSPFSMKHRRSRSSIEPVSGSAKTVMKAMADTHRQVPLPTPPE